MRLFRKIGKGTRRTAVGGGESIVGMSATWTSAKFSSSSSSSAISSGIVIVSVCSEHLRERKRVSREEGDEVRDCDVIVPGMAEQEVRVSWFKETSLWYRSVGLEILASPMSDCGGMRIFRRSFFSEALKGVLRPKRLRGDHGDGIFGVLGDMDFVVVGGSRIAWDVLRRGRRGVGGGALGVMYLSLGSIVMIALAMEDVDAFLAWTGLTSTGTQRVLRVWPGI